MVIPTPKHIETRTGRKHYRSSGDYKILLKGDVTHRLRFAADLLARKASDDHGIALTVAEHDDHHSLTETDIVISHDPTGSDHLTGLDDLARRAFDSPVGKEQGYVLKSAKGSPVILLARNDTGCLYAVATLLQLFEKDTAGAVLPDVEVWDYPDFRYRGNNWLLWGECGYWSYDRGDGIDAYVNRVIDRLDMSLLYKVNAVIIDGLGLNGEKFPGYGAMMRKLNSEARVRGIKLQYAGYDEGYGASARYRYHGEVWKNRRTYPDGEVYACCGRNPHMPAEEDPSRTCGTCASNDELIKLKQAELENFVRQVEPGLLYLHSLDIGYPKTASESWKLRCPECRRRWPNDDIAAEDGHAGARAHLFNALAVAVARVKKPGYDGEKDCTVVFIGPIYSSQGRLGTTSPPEEWHDFVRYLEAISRLLKDHPAVKLGIRELGLDPVKNEKQVLELSRRLAKNGSGHALYEIYFYGGDGYLDGSLFTPMPALNAMQEGVEILMNASGNAFQEPLQFLNAEYAWNWKNTAFHKEPMPETVQEFWKLSVDYFHGKARPESIYGPGGFLDIACERLYGPDNGPKIAEFYRLVGENGEAPACYVCSPDFKVIFKRQLWDGKNEDDEISKSAVSLREIERVTAQASAIMNDVDPSSSDARSADLEWLKISVECGLKYSHLFRRFYELFHESSRFLSDETKASSDAPRRTQLLADLESLTQYLADTRQWVTASFPSDTVDPLGSDTKLKLLALDTLEHDLSRMSDDVTAGVRTRPQNQLPEGW